MSGTPRQEIKLFYCYAREDKALRDELAKHFSWLQRRYQLTDWHDRAILPGEEWEPTIDKHLNTADLVLLLISSDFMNSDYCYGKEMQKALERHKAGTCRVIPILLRPTYWEGAPFSNLQMLPVDTRPITLWPNRDEAYQSVVTEISRTIKDLLLSLQTKEELLKNDSTIRQSRRNDEALAAVSVPNTEQYNLNVIDLSIKAAYKIGADQHPVSLADLHAEYLHTNPGIRKGKTPESFSATINYHTINMRSRFPDPQHKDQPAPWLSRPMFKRVSHAHYMLLSPDEVALFHLRVEEGDPRIYEDEYNIDNLR